jgi:hypothetical protein
MLYCTLEEIEIATIKFREDKKFDDQFYFTFNNFCCYFNFFSSILSVKYYDVSGLIGVKNYGWNSSCLVLHVAILFLMIKSIR